MKTLIRLLLPFFVILAMLAAFSYFKINPFKPLEFSPYPSPSPSHALFPVASQTPQPTSD